MDKNGNSDRLGFQKSLWTVIAAMKLKDTPWKKSCDTPRQRIQKQDITLLTQVCIVKTVVFLVVTYGYESRTMKRRLSGEDLMLWSCGAGEDS